MTNISNSNKNKNSLQGKVYRLNKNKGIFKIFRLRKIMLRNDSIIRPRRSNGTWTNNLDTKGNGSIGSILRTRANDFSVAVPRQYNSEAIYKKKERHAPKSITKTMIKQLETYCDKTTLHGLRYVGDPSLSFGERVFWFISFSVAIAFATYYIRNIYDKWNSSPVIISFSPFDTDLSSIPFPAVTICNMNQAKQSEAERIIRDGNLQEMKLLNDVCNGNQTFSDSEQYNWTTLRNFLVKVGSSCSDMLKVCQWTSDKKDCEELFNNDLTDEGLCCSFNRLPPKQIFRNENDISVLNQTYPSNVYDWNPETGFTEAETGDENTIPKRPLGAGAHLGLTIVLDAQVDNYYCSSTSSAGFKIILSNPIETPKMADFGTLLSPGVEARFSITPSVREATDNLRDISITKRQCYFSNERRLQYYRVYTIRNCELECMSRYMHKICSCVPYYLPKNDTMRYCEQSDDECVVGIKRYVTTEVEKSTSCDCLPGCTEIKFMIQDTYSKLSEKKLKSEYWHLNVTRKYFAAYTKRNCNLECQSNYTFEHCGCIPYFLPRNKIIKVCGQSDQTCVTTAKEDMEITYGNGSSCHCLPGCFEMSFLEGRSYSTFSEKMGIKHDIGNISFEYLTKNIAVVHFFFPSSKFTKQIKSQLYGFTEILSNIGGLLGLCMGFSFLSIVELVYFVTLRIVCNYMKTKKKDDGNEMKEKHNSDHSVYPFIK